MGQLLLPLSDKQRHINRKNLNTRIKNSKDKSFVIEGGHDYVVHHFGQVLSKGGKFIIVLKGQIYRLVFNDTSTVLYTTPYNPENIKNLT